LAVFEQLPVAHILVGSNQQDLLCMCPSIPPDVWSQLIVPTLPALFADSPWERLSNKAPAAFSMLLHQPAQETLTSVGSPRNLQAKYKTDNISEAVIMPDKPFIVAGLPIAFDLSYGMSLPFLSLSNWWRLEQRNHSAES